MRPTLEALAEQQQLITKLTQRLDKQAKTIQQLGNGLYHLASMAGGDVQARVASAMLRTADAQNPAQPVPEPPAAPPTQSTQEVETPEAFANVQDPGLVPGSTNDVAADATTTAYTPGMDIQAQPFKQLVDVTQPVDGTQNPRPLEETKTLTDVRVGNPMNPQTAFPLQGEFQNAQRTASKQDQADTSRRIMAALRLARLRMQAGIAEAESDIALATTIEKDASLSLTAIEHEIATLDSVKTAATKRAASARLVPRATNQQPRPSLQGGTARTASAAPVSADTEDSDLFDD